MRRSNCCRPVGTEVSRAPQKRQAIPSHALLVFLRALCAIRCLLASFASVRHARAVTVARDGQEALNIFKSHNRSRIDLLLTDDLMSLPVRALICTLLKGQSDTLTGAFKSQ